MLLYYLITRKFPHVSEHLYKTWSDDVYNLVLSEKSDGWSSLPVRFARLILNSTKNKQSERLDVGQILGELELLRDALHYPETVTSTELLTEELMKRTVDICSYPKYLWNQDTLRASLDLPSGLQFSLQANETKMVIELIVEWSSSGNRQYKNIKKYLKPAVDSSILTLLKNGWAVKHSPEIRSDLARFSASIGSKSTCANLGLQAKVFSGILQNFKF